MITDDQIDELIGFDEEKIDRPRVRQWLSEIEAERNSRIADSLLTADASLPAFLKEQAQ